MIPPAPAPLTPDQVKLACYRIKSVGSTRDADLQELAASHEALRLQLAQAAQAREETQKEWLKTEAERESWRSRWSHETLIVDEVWAALGISTVEQAGGRHIAQIVRDIKQQLEQAEARIVTLEQEIASVNPIVELTCAFCRVDLGDETHHKPDCLWIRVRAVAEKG